MTFAERYVGVAREVCQLASPRGFATRFPEVNAAIGYVGFPPDEAVQACFELYRRHAAGVERALQDALGRVGVLHLQSIPPHSLLGVVLGRAALPRLEVLAEPESERGFVVDRSRFEVRYNGQSCPFGNIKEFALVERLDRARGTYLPITTLGQDVWDDAGVAKINVQRVACNARRRLSSGLGLPPGVIDGDQPSHYRLVVPAS